MDRLQRKVEILLRFYCGLSVGHVFVKISHHRISLISKWIYFENCKALLCVPICISVTFIYTSCWMIGKGQNFLSRGSQATSGIYEVVAFALCVMTSSLVCMCSWWTGAECLRSFGRFQLSGRNHKISELSRSFELLCQTLLCSHES